MTTNRLPRSYELLSICYIPTAALLPRNQRRTHTTRLTIAKLESERAGANVFDVSGQGDKLLTEFDIDSISGSQRVGTKCDLAGVESDSELQIDFTALRR